MQTYKIIGMLMLLGLVALFTFQNTEVTNIQFLFWSISMSTSLLLLTALFSGIIIGLVLSVLNGRRVARTGRSASKAPAKGHSYQQ